ncbi:hypothetical protein K4H51_09765, partial [Clostridium chauvoei]|nr:hypothetical protein [Clostridium chauvoei]
IIGVYMNNEIITIGIVFSFILGTLLHFTYKIFNNNRFIGYFSAINESVWEHIKLSIFPILIFMLIIICFNYENINNLFFSLGFSLLLSLTLVPSIFYSYTYITKKPVLIIDISIFILAVILPFLLIKFITNLPPLPNFFEILGILLTTLIILSFFYFTYNPPNTKLFIQYTTKG